MSPTSRAAPIASERWRRFRQERAAFIAEIVAHGRSAPPMLPPEVSAELPGIWPDDLPGFTQVTFNHVLYSFPKARGNGHKFGYALAPESAFPEEWSDVEVFEAIIATLRNGSERRIPNGFYERRLLIRGYYIGVLITPDRRQVQSAYRLFDKYVQGGEHP